MGTQVDHGLDKRGLRVLAVLPKLVIRTCSLKLLVTCYPVPGAAAVFDPQPLCAPSRIYSSHHHAFSFDDANSSSTAPATNYMLVVIEIAPPRDHGN